MPELGDLDSLMGGQFLEARDDGIHQNLRRGCPGGDADALPADLRQACPFGGIAQQARQDGGEFVRIVAGEQAAAIPVAAAQVHVGVGAALVWHGLRTLRQMGAAGCVVLGEPAYYGRFGFRSTPAMRLEGAPPGCFLVRPFDRLIPLGTVHYHPAFDLLEPSDWTFP